MTKVQLVMQQSATVDIVFDNGRWKTGDPVLTQFLNEDLADSVARVESSGDYIPDKEELAVRIALEKYPGSIVTEQRAKEIDEDEMSGEFIRY